MLPYAAETVAEALLAILDDAAAARGRATLAIPGGRAPLDALAALARICDPFLRERLHLLWVDERAVPVGHADRNDRSTLAAWQAGGAAPAHVHPMPAQRADLDAAAADYARTLAIATAGAPLDACLLGIGEDGHLASLFPHHPGLAELADVFAVRDSPKPPPQRLTLGLAPLARAAHRIVLCHGEAKGRIYARARRGPDRALPVSLLPAAGTVWYLDDAAAAAAAG